MNGLARNILRATRRYAQKPIESVLKVTFACSDMKAILGSRRQSGKRNGYTVREGDGFSISFASDVLNLDDGRALQQESGGLLGG
jgi:hypothetical protein